MREELGIDVTVVVALSGDWPKAADCLGCVLAQEDVPVEVVVVDCSAGAAAPTDVERLLADARVTVTGGTQHSAAVARNRGVRAARGRWLAFLDDSDLWAPGHLATLLNEAGDADFAYCASWIIDQRRQIVGYRSVPRASELQPELLSEDAIGSPSSVIAQRGFWERTGGFDEWLTALAPWDLWIRWSRAGTASMSSTPTVAAQGIADAPAVRQELDELRRRYGTDAKRAGRNFGSGSSTTTSLADADRPAWVVEVAGRARQPPRQAY